MAAVTSTVVKESAEELTQRIKEATTAREKDKLQVLYWLKQEKAPALEVIGCVNILRKATKRAL